MTTNGGYAGSSEDFLRQLKRPAPRSETHDPERLWASFVVIDAVLSIALHELPEATKSKIAERILGPLQTDLETLVSQGAINPSRVAGTVRALKRILQDLQ